MNIVVYINLLGQMVNKIYEFYKENQFLRVLLLFMIVLLPWLLAFLILTSKAQEEIVLSAEINRPEYEDDFYERIQNAIRYW